MTKANANIAKVSTNASIRMVTRSQTNKGPQVNYYESDSDCEINGPTVQSRRIVMDIDEIPRIVTRSVAKAQMGKCVDIDFDGASKIWRKTHPNRYR
jgi:hypothetical protein